MRSLHITFPLQYSIDEEAEEDDAVEDALDEVGSALLLDEDELLDSLELLLEELLHSLVELHVDVVSGVQVEVGVQVVDGSCQVEVVEGGGGGSLVVAGAPSPYSQEPCRTPASVLEKYSKRPWEKSRPPYSHPGH